MKILNSIISIFKVIIGALCVFITSILCGINPKNELFYRKTCSKILTKMFAKEIIIEGKLDPEAQLLIGNHTHNMDIALMETIIPEKLIWVAKKELGETPVIKYMLTKTDMILVDRNNKRSILQMIKEIKERTQRGLKVVLFPEGTRNKLDPKKMITWKNGVKGVAEKLNLKVQPFVIINLPFAFKKNPFRIEPQTIKVIFLDSFYPKDNPNWYEETRKKMQEILDKEYQKLNN
ncbi:lysophospholipid acyltransferase family protein [Caminibacter pacificus]